MLFVSSSLCAAGIECVGVPHHSLHVFDAIILFSISFEAALQEILSLGAALLGKLVKMNGRLDDNGSTPNYFQVRALIVMPTRSI